MFVARIGLVTQQILRIFGHLLQITKIVHVGVEAGATKEIGTNTDSHYNDNGSYQSSLAIYGVVVNTVNQCKCFLVNLVGLGVQQLRQISQAEQGCAEDGKSCKEAEILQEVCLDKDESGKRADGCQTAQPDGFHLVAQQLCGITHIFEMGQHMEYITQCHTENDTSNAQCQQRELSLQPIHHGQAEKRTKGNRQQEQRNGVPVTETDKKEHQHKDQCTCDSCCQVVLDLCRIIIAAGRCTMITDTYVGMALGILFHLCVQHLEES